MKKYSLLLLFILIMFLAACGGEPEVQAPQPLAERGPVADAGDAGATGAGELGGAAAGVIRQRQHRVN